MKQTPGQPRRPPQIKIRRECTESNNNVYHWTVDTEKIDISVQLDDLIEFVQFSIPPLIEEFLENGRRWGPIAEIVLEYWPDAIEWIEENRVFDPYIYYYQQYFVMPFGNAYLALSGIARSIDPNDKIAPTGFSEAGYIQSDDSLSYTVRFENQPSATAPAQQVIITDVLDGELRRPHWLRTHRSRSSRHSPWKPAMTNPSIPARK